jgi:1-acyl-sn-glycerol-3-phosphate acyltransferase
MFQKSSRFLKNFFQIIFKYIYLIIIRIFYRVEVKGLSNIPSSGSIILAGNHISYIDGFFIYSFLKRPARFIVDWVYYSKPFLKPFFDLFDSIPIAPRKYDPEILEKAFDNIENKICEGEVICIFPEGFVTKDGKIGKFHGGVERILERKWTPVVPFSITGLWGSIFSWEKGKVFLKFPKHFRMNVVLEFGKPILDKQITVEKIKKEVCLLEEKNRN